MTIVVSVSGVIETATTFGENSDPRRPRMLRFRGHGSRRGNESVAAVTFKIAYEGVSDLLLTRTL